MPGIDVSTSFTLLLAIAGIVVAALIGFASYRHPVPPLPSSWRIILSILRSLVLALVFLLIGQPVIALVHRWVQRPVVAVLVDNSQSLTLTDRAGTRPTLVRAAAASDELQTIARTADLRWFLFDHTLRSVESWRPDSATFSGDRTDIAGAFRRLRTEIGDLPLSAAVLITDGNATSAENPVYDAEALSVPVFTVGVGDSLAPPDIRIAAIQSNSVAYAQSRVPVQVTVRSSGFSGRTVEVTLQHRGRPADRQRVILSGAGDQKVTLFFEPESSGMQRSVVSVSVLDGEATARNNSSAFFTRVLAERMKVLLVASRPDPDVGFLVRALTADSNLTLTVRTQRPDGRFGEGPLDEPTVRSTELLILVGIPDASTTTAILQLLTRDEFSRLPVLSMPLRTTDMSKLRPMNSLVPYTADQFLPTELTIFASIPESRRLHPLIRLDGSVTDGDWASLPPLFRTQATIRPRPESDVLATVRIQSVVLQDPLLIARQAAGRRSMALTAYGLWRWKLLAPREGNASRIYDLFVSAAVRWLTSPDDERRIRIRPVKASFSALEAPEFSGQVYDESLQPFPAAEIGLTITGDGRTYTATLSPSGNGQYQGVADILPPGEYSYRALVRSGATVLGEDRGSFSVGGLNAEFLETRLNRPLLEAIAHRTGGTYFDARRLTGLADQASRITTMAPTDRIQRTDLDLWRSPWMLAALIVLLTIEWASRKRLGML